jgi:hypothetical protein
MLLDLQLEDIVRLRKVHPCGSYEWRVVRLGADIGLECLGCKRRVLLPRRQLAQRMKSVRHMGTQPPVSHLPEVNSSEDEPSLKMKRP